MLVEKNAQPQAPADRRGAVMAALLGPRVDSIGTAAGLLGGSAPRPSGYQAAWLNLSFGVLVKK
jgi:hypothetical protein